MDSHSNYSSISFFPNMHALVLWRTSHKWLLQVQLKIVVDNIAEKEKFWSFLKWIKITKEDT